MRFHVSPQRAALSVGAAALVALGACTAQNPDRVLNAGPDGDPDMPIYITLSMKQGPMADYGATPWYTNDISIGQSPMALTLDSGASFFWATSDLCTTTACLAHARVNTTQPGFKWIDKTRTKRSFGPWGDMYTYTGQAPLNIHNYPYISADFFASVEYTGPKFQYLTWGGGIGLPSESSGVTPGSSFIMQELFRAGYLPSPEFGFITEPTTGVGETYLGYHAPEDAYYPLSEIKLGAVKGPIGYLWGTRLYSFAVANVAVPTLTNQIFYLDSGSSRFKGDRKYLQPIMERFANLRDPSGNLIFTKTYENGAWTGLYYTNGGPSDYRNLPNVTLTMGQTCSTDPRYSAQILLMPDQYSYYVDQGEHAGKYALAFHVLDGVGGLLVGSTFMDLFYSRFTYNVTPTQTLTQGDMYLYTKTKGEQPAHLTCVNRASAE